MNVTCTFSYQKKAADVQKTTYTYHMTTFRGSKTGTDVESKAQDLSILSSTTIII